ncbi:MAG: alpha/beta hydrolase [Anaerolineae bacterium]|nr:alpha/beta hydrolase [Anaerolineae bacterium]
MQTATFVSTAPALPHHEQRGRGCLFLVRRGLTALVVLAIVLAGLGFVYETAAEASDRQTYLPPGQLLSIDDHQMHIDCTGEGSPTVILEAAGGHFSAEWARVQPVIAQGTRVCAYDRAGYGWSDPGPEPRDAEHIAGELHGLLAAASIEPPYVLVGHSVGGIYVRVFNAQYPGEVVGMVLVDSSHPDQWVRQGESISTMQAMASVSAVISRIGLMRLAFGSQDLGLPPEQNAAVIANLSSAQYWNTQRADIASVEQSIAQGQAAGDLGDLPLEVLASVDYPEGSHQDIELALQRELAALSSNSHFQVVDGARHITLVTGETYAPFVNDAILRVLEAARSGEPLAPREE